MNFNKVIVVGRVGKDPEVKALPSGSMVANFSLATSRVWTKDGEKHEETEWNNIVLWGKLAEIAEQYVSKGMLLLVEGHLATRSWDDNDTGKKMYRTEIVAESFQLPPKSTSGEGSEKGYSRREAEEEANRQFDGEDAPPKKTSNARAYIKKKTSAPVESDEEEINPEDIPF